MRSRAHARAILPVGCRSRCARLPSNLRLRAGAGESRRAPEYRLAPPYWSTLGELQPGGPYSA
jgi:hypothetical protein